ncbi:hypothetical protein KY321_04985 [Candidatus Woesearchaeota archaeon]|nr:hypothetical protein [Candidatus Woesearchaeota archaeon]
MAIGFDTPNGMYGFCNNLFELVSCPYDFEWMKIKGDTSLLYATKPEMITISKEGVDITLPSTIYGELGFERYHYPVHFNSNLINNQLPFQLSFRDITIYDFSLNKERLDNFKIRECETESLESQIEKFVLKMFAKNKDTMRRASKILDKIENGEKITLDVAKSSYGL